MPLEVRRPLAKLSRGFYQVREAFRDNLPTHRVLREGLLGRTFGCNRYTSAIIAACWQLLLTLFPFGV